MSGEGLTGFVSTISSGLSGSALWGVIGDIAPFIIGLVLFALGFWLIRRLVKGSAKAKVKM